MSISSNYSKRLNTNNKDNYLIMIEFVLCLFTMYFTVTNNLTLSSFCFTLSFIFLIVLFLKELMFHKLKNEELPDFFLLVAIVLISLTCVVGGDLSSSFSFDYFRKYFIFCSTIIYLFVVSRIETNEKIIQFILKINLVFGFIYVYSFYLGEGIIYYGYTGLLSFNFTNPNLAAMWLLQTIFYLSIAILFFKKKPMKFICLLLFILITTFLINTGARNSYIALTIYIMIVTYIVIKRNIKLDRMMIFVLILYPIIFATAYMFIANDINTEGFQFLISEGKGMDSRLDAWSDAFHVITLYPITGGYYQISDGTGASQMLNTHIDILASYGTIVFMLTIIYIMRICYKINSKCVSKLQTIGLLAFLASIVMGTGEAALFSGGLGIHILVCSFLLIARYKNENLNE